MLRYCDISVDENLIGEKVSINSILNRDIVIIKYREMKSKCSNGGICLQVQFKYNESDNEYYIFFSGSNVIRKQLNNIDRKMFPFIGKIIKQNKYYKLV